MSAKTVKELHCKMCSEKFCGPNRLVQALIHLRNKHQGIFETRYKKKQKRDVADLRSSIVTSSQSSPEQPCMNSNSSLSTNGSAIKDEAIHSTVSPKKSTVYPVPGKMKIYFSQNDSNKAKPYRCNRCGKHLTNLKMCVVHLVKDHGIPLKQNPACTSDRVLKDTASPVCNSQVLRQTARKTISARQRRPVKANTKPGNSLNNLKEKARECRRRKPRFKSRFALPDMTAIKIKEVTQRRKKREAERKRIMKIKVGLIRQHCYKPSSTVEDFVDDSLSPEDCFNFFSEPNSQEEVVEDSQPSKFTTSSCGKPSPSNVMDVSSTVSLDKDEDAGKRAGIKEKSLSSTLGIIDVSPVNKSSDKQTAESDSLWNLLCWNSTHALGNSNNVSSSGIPARKRAISTDNFPPLPAQADRSVAAASKPVVGASAPNHSTAMLKQLRTTSLNVVKPSSENQNSGLLNKPVQRSKSSPFSTATTLPKDGMKKTARKTTRRNKKLIDSGERKNPVSVISFFSTEENERCFARELDSPSSLPDLSPVTSNFTQNLSSEATKNSSSNPSSTFHPSSDSTISYASSPSTSSHSTSHSSLERLEVNTSTPKKATGRKSAPGKSR